MRLSNKADCTEICIRLGGVRNKKLPVSICIEGPDGMVIPLIKKGSKLPCFYREVFSPTASFQMSAYLHLMVGNRPCVANNRDLCIIRQDEGAFQSAGKAHYEVQIRVSEGGRINVSTNNPGQKKSSTTRISCPNTLITEQEVNRLIQDAKENAEVDGNVLKTYHRLDHLRDRIRNIDESLWPAARRKMSFSEKRSYRQFRKNIDEILRKGPRLLDDKEKNTIDLYEEQINQWHELMEKDAQKVAKWYW